jgi:hypothetical protein
MWHGGIDTGRDADMDADVVDADADDADIDGEVDI